MKYLKKPVEVYAIQWNGSNLEELKQMDGFERFYIYHGDCLRILTLKGIMSVSVGDYVIKGIHGEFYACKPDIFAESYTEAKHK